MRAIVLVALVATGCAQVLGLDDTKLDKIDAAIDAPGICDGAPQCTSLDGRSVCGQLFSGANVPLRAANPTGLKCDASNTTGPCAFTVKAQPKSDFLAASPTGLVDGIIDDCGRYAVIDFPQQEADVAVIVSGDDTIFKRTATLLLGRTTLGGPGNVDRGVDVPVVAKVTAMTWATQVMGSGTPPDTATGYLIRYMRQGRPLANVQVAKDGSNGFSTKPGTVPWASYFSGTTGLGDLDPAVNETRAAGTAFAVFGGGTFSLQGLISGRRCRIDGLNQIDNTLIYVTLPNC